MATESGRIERTCAECGETFSAYPSENRKYCRRECYFSQGVNRIPDDELIGDLQRVAGELDRTPSINDYNTHGKHHADTYKSRFGSWAGACEAAGLEPNQVGGKRYEGHERTAMMIYGFEKNLVERARDIMEERHGERFPLHIVVAHLAELYIDEFGDGATEEAADD